MRNLCVVFLALTLLDSSMSIGATTETRGIWVDKKTLFAPKESVLAFLDAAKAANFNSLYVNTYFRGEVLYPGSAYMPQARELKGEDILKWLLPEIHKRGMRAEAWTEYGFYAFHTDKATTGATRGAILDKHPELAGIDSKGNKFLHHPDWGDFFVLCPVNPKSQEILLNIFAETLSRYDFDGINLDRIRFARKNYCFCDYCKQKFRADTGLALTEFPEGSKEWQTFVRWRKEHLTDFMKRLSERLRAIRPGISITSAVASPEQIDEYGQDYPTWLAKGYLDAAMPMLYAADITAAVAQVRKVTRPQDKIFTGLDAGGNRSQALVNQIKQARAAGASGITLWYSGSVEDDFPLLRETVFKDRAAPHFPMLFPEHKEIPR
jgi:uncharacterized lipoprotein YddW (UPF0748 family)